MSGHDWRTTQSEPRDCLQVIHSAAKRTTSQEYRCNVISRRHDKAIQVATTDSLGGWLALQKSRWQTRHDDVLDVAGADPTISYTRNALRADIFNEHNNFFTREGEKVMPGHLIFDETSEA